MLGGRGEAGDEGWHDVRQEDEGEASGDLT